MAERAGDPNDTATRTRPSADRAKAAPGTLPCSEAMAQYNIPRSGSASATIAMMLAIALSARSKADIRSSISSVRWPPALMSSRDALMEAWASSNMVCGCG